MYGCVSYGSLIPGVPQLIVNQVMPYRVVLNGTDVTSITIDGSVDISDVIEERSTSKFSIRDNGKTIHTTPGESVYITWYGARIFGGSVETVEEDAPDTDSTLFLHIRAVDFSSLADRYLVTAKYEGWSVRDIVTDIVNIQTPLSVDGVTLDDVQEGVVVSVASFNYKKASDCFRDLSNATGMVWNINAFRVLQFYDRATYVAPFNVGDLNPVYRDFRYSRSRSQYRNRQYLRAGKDKTDWMTDNIRGSSVISEDGGSPVTPAKRNRTFLLRYDLAELYPTSETAPTNFLILKNGAQQRVGIKGIDIDDDLSIPYWCQWFIEYGSKEISQNSAEDEVNNPTLLPDQTLSVKYKGYFPIIVDDEASEEIENRKSIEGGSGEYQAVEDDEDVEGRDLANEKASMLLNRYGRIPNSISYTTDVPGLMAGHLQTNRFLIHGLADTQFLINSVQINILHGPFLRCSIKALDGEREGGWSDYFRRQWQAGRKFTIRANEKLLISKTARDVLMIGDTLTESVHDGVTLHDWDEDPFTFALLGFFQEDTYAYPLPGCVVGRSKIGIPYGY